MCYISLRFTYSLTYLETFSPWLNILCHSHVGPLGLVVLVNTIGPPLSVLLAGTCFNHPVTVINCDSNVCKYANEC